MNVKNVIETKNLSLRIPSELANLIDEFISSTGEYTNRPDFIMSAIRFTHDLIFRLRAKALNSAHTYPVGEPAKERKTIKPSFFFPNKVQKEIEKFLKEEREFVKRRYSFTKNDYEKFLSETIGVLWKGYDKYAGDPELILVKVPSAWSEYLYRGIDSSIKNLQDFVRISLVNYILFINCRLGVEKYGFIADGILDDRNIPEKEILELRQNLADFMQLYIFMTFQ